MIHNIATKIGDTFHLTNLVSLSIAKKNCGASQQKPSISKGKQHLVRGK